MNLPIPFLYITFFFCIKLAFVNHNKMKIFKNKILLISGGTGSFGNAVLRRLLDSDLKEIRILSRDEKKQDDMRKNTIIKN